MEGRRREGRGAAGHLARFAMLGLLGMGLGLVPLFLLVCRFVVEEVLVVDVE